MLDLNNLCTWMIHTLTILLVEELLNGMQNVGMVYIFIGAK